MSANIEITILNFQGILSILNHRQDLRELSRILKIEGISHIVIPNISPSFMSRDTSFSAVKSPFADLKVLFRFLI